MNDPFLKVITSVFLAGAGHQCWPSVLWCRFKSWSRLEFLAQCVSFLKLLVGFSVGSAVSSHTISVNGFSQ